MPSRPTSPRAASGPSRCPACTLSPGELPCCACPAADAASGMCRPPLPLPPPAAG
jgi:hypothetical protein